MNPSPDEPRRTLRPCGGRWWRRVLFGLGALAALVVIFYAEEDWRGQRDWNQYRQAIEARGESLDLKFYIPKPVPDDQNFAASPMMRSLLQPDYSLLTNDLYTQVDGYISETNFTKVRGYRHFLDLVAWQMASVANQTGELKRELEASLRPGRYGSAHSNRVNPSRRPNFESDKTDLADRAAAAPAVLEGMKPDEAAFNALRVASARPYSRFPIQYNLEDASNIPLPHLSRIQEICWRLNLIACAELAAGQTDKALTDVKLTLDLADSIKTEPFLISYLERVACFQLAIQPVWEGLAEHGWTELQMQELEARFQCYDFPADMDQALKRAQGSGSQLIDEVKKEGLGLAEYFGVDLVLDIDLSDPHKRFLNAIGRIMPAGWYDQERLKYYTASDELMKGVIVLSEEKVSPSQLASNYAKLNRQFPDPELPTSVSAILHHEVIMPHLLVSLSKLPIKAARPQIAANQAAIACALERYRLANGHFPETLNALTPQFISRLPNDVITGQPYQYRRTEDGQFILYSVGWNEKDDGGVPGQTLFDQTQGDWVWAYPTP
jgi:hypothetical protein